jgi:hypothetical protein
MNVSTAMKVVEDWLDEDSNDMVFDAWMVLRRRILNSAKDIEQAGYAEGKKQGEANVRALV